jgi:outer membrane lipoprotein-sorting protein
VIHHCIRFDALISRLVMKIRYLRSQRRFRAISDKALVLSRAFTIMFLLLPIVFPLDQAFCQPNVRPEDIPSFLTRKGRDLSAFKAVMKVVSAYNGGKSRQDVNGFLLYRRPSDFRFQGMAPGGNSLFELVIKANRFRLYIPTEGKIMEGGRACFNRKFPDVGEIEGLIPMILLQWKDVRFDRLLARDLEKIVIRVSFQGRVWGATFDPHTLYLKRLVRLSPAGEVDLTADFGDFKTGQNGWLPRRFEVQSPAGQWKTLVHIERIEANPFLVENNFKLQTPTSAKIEDCR